MSLAPDLRPVDTPPAPDEDLLLSPAMRFAIGLFVVVPLLSVLLAIPVAWGGWLGWTDVLLAVAFWAITALGITLGYHRYFTHGSFKTNRAMKILLAITGSMALQGSLDQWVADHRKHHQFTDEVGDPHSPWRFGTSRRAVAKGLAFAHVGWLFSPENTSIRQYAPDIDDDRDLRRISAWFPAIALASMFLPAVIGGLITWSWIGALTAFFWAGLLRIAFVHHVTWSINSVCHVFGKRPFASRDLSTNVAWLAIPSFGESWHNLHHVDPTAARHGVLRGQLDISAEIIRGLEGLRLVSDVRWPKPERLAKKLTDPKMRFRLRGYHEPVSTRP